MPASPNIKDFPLVERSVVETKLKLPPRLIQYQPYTDRNKYSGDDLRALRKMRGVGKP